MISFFDGLLNVLSNLSNRRNVVASNSFTHLKLNAATLRAIYKSGVGSKIVKIKAGYSLNDTLQFDDVATEEYYNTKLAHDVLKTVKYMLGFGRGIMVMYQSGDDLSKPYSPDATRLIKHRVFSGDMVTVSEYGTDFEDERYYKPLIYSVRGKAMHWSRVVDFVYHEPVEEEAPTYSFGGISEFEMIYPQLINDAVVERASGSIVEKNATVFYKVKGFREMLQLGKDKDLIKYFSALEDNRSIYGAGIVDGEDAIETVSQALTNLDDVNNISLRRLALVTGIPLPWLIGENVGGLNSTGENERLIMQDMIESLQFEYLLHPINRVMRLHRQKPVTFKNNQGETPTIRVEYEGKVIANAKLLNEMGEDQNEYLERHDVIKKEDVDKFFEALEGEKDELTEEELKQPLPLPEPTNEAQPNIIQ